MVEPSQTLRTPAHTLRARPQHPCCVFDGISLVLPHRCWVGATLGGGGRPAWCCRSASFGGAAVTSVTVAVLRLFAAAREAAGTGSVEIDAETVGDVLTEARARFGRGFTDVLDSAMIWLDGESTDGAAPVDASSEVAVLPPVSGGC